MGRNEEHLVVTVEDKSGERFDLIWWQGADGDVPEGWIDLAYTARSSDFRGERRVQIEWIDARPAGEVEAGPIVGRLRAVVVDHRQDPRPRETLGRLLSQEGAQVWSEAEHRAEVGGRDRRELESGRALVIWTTPPGPAELDAVLERVAPDTVHLFARDAGLDRPQVFLKRLTGLAKNAIAHAHGQASMAALAAATSQRQRTVRAGLAWLAARGHLTVTEEGEDRVSMAVPGERARRAEVEEAAKRVRELLAETAAYRAHFSRAAADGLI